MTLVATTTPSCALASAQRADQPNIVYIVADDMRKDDLDWMPKTKELIFDSGITYDAAFNATSQCCPSRSEMLRGQYAHNTGVLDNEAPKGGYPTFKNTGDIDDNLPVWLQNAGYTTALFGKYLNEYQPSDPVPPGWSEWYARGHVDYYNYYLNENGSKVHYGSQDEDYLTDVVSGKATDFIDRHASNTAPFFAYVAPVAPHNPAPPAPRHKDLFASEEAPKNPNFDEADVSDKPRWVRNLKLRAGEKDKIDSIFRKRIRSLQAVDEMVEAIVNHLSVAGELENTYIVFTSDNGWHYGEHRLWNHKNSAFEESIDAPLGIRGPGIPAGRHTDQLAVNIDLAPTFADLGGADLPTFVDGRSLKPTFQQDAPGWRSAFLEEFWNGNSPVPEHRSVRTADGKKYVYYVNSGSEELYDLTSDPYELVSKHDDSAYASTKTDLQQRLNALISCFGGQSCRDAEDGAAVGASGAPALEPNSSTSDPPAKKNKKNKKNSDKGE